MRMIDPQHIYVGDKVKLEITGKQFDCLVIYKDEREYQCQTTDQSPLFGKWTSLLFKNDSIKSNYGNATIFEHESMLGIQFMNENVKCENCKFFVCHQKDATGFCWRYPPQVIKNESKINIMQSNYTSENPKVYKAQWCGEFQHKDS